MHHKSLQNLSIPIYKKIFITSISNKLNPNYDLLYTQTEIPHQNFILLL